MRSLILFPILLAISFGLVYADDMTNYTGIGSSGIHSMYNGTIHIPGEIWFDSIYDSVMAFYHNATSDRWVQFPDKSGTVAFLSDITGGGGGEGENNTASNIGTGTGLFHSKVGVDLRFHSLSAGSGISINDIGNEIQIGSTGGSGGGANVTTTTCGGTQKISAINNVTGTVTCTDDQEGPNPPTVLNDLTDVTTSSPVYNHILQFINGQWVNKLFAIDTKSALNDIFITGINNQTGAITTNQFSVNLKACS